MKWHFYLHRSNAFHAVLTTLSFSFLTAYFYISTPGRQSGYKGSDSVRKFSRKGSCQETRQLGLQGQDGLRSENRVVTLASDLS